jgi:hypothetical protein
MRKIRLDGSFFLSLLINMVLNLEGTIPAWILLILHFLCDWSILWFWMALGIWLFCLILGMLLIRFASRCGTPDPPKENKNPYSVGKKKD